MWAMATSMRQAAAATPSAATANWRTAAAGGHCCQDIKRKFQTASAQQVRMAAAATPARAAESQSQPLRLRRMAGAHPKPAIAPSASQAARAPVTAAATSQAQTGHRAESSAAGDNSRRAAARSAWRKSGALASSAAAPRTAGLCGPAPRALRRATRRAVGSKGRNSSNSICTAPPVRCQRVFRCWGADSCLAG